MNPVQWLILRDHGIALRGPHPRDLNLDPEPDKLREWNLANLNGYWTAYAEAMRHRRVRRKGDRLGDPVLARACTARSRPAA